MKNFKRIVSLIVAILMVLECVPLSALAAEPTGGIGGEFEYYTVIWKASTTSSDDNYLDKLVVKENTLVTIKPSKAEGNIFLPVTANTAADKQDNKEDKIIHVYPDSPASGNGRVGTIYLGVYVDGKFTAYASTGIYNSSGVNYTQPGSFNTAIDNMPFDDLPKSGTEYQEKTNWLFGTDKNDIRTSKSVTRYSSTCTTPYISLSAATYYAVPDDVTKNNYYSVTYQLLLSQSVRLYAYLSPESTGFSTTVV